MNEFFTWEMLATYAGATVATSLITELIKKFGVKINARLLAYIVSVVVLIAANYFTGVLSVSTAVITLMNAAVVSLASNGAYDVVSKTKKTTV